MTTYARPRFGPMFDPSRKQTEEELADVQQRMMQQWQPRASLEDIVGALREAQRIGDESAFNNAQQELFRFGFTIEELPPDLQTEMMDPIEVPETGPGVMMQRKFADDSQEH